MTIATTAMAEDLYLWVLEHYELSARLKLVDADRHTYRVRFGDGSMFHATLGADGQWHRCCDVCFEASTWHGSHREDYAYRCDDHPWNVIDAHLAFAHYHGDPEPDCPACRLKPGDDALRVFARDRNEPCHIVGVATSEQLRDAYIMRGWWVTTASRPDGFVASTRDLVPLDTTLLPRTDW